jgi:RNA polymerase sigma-70 factor, ECF subfamily
MTEVDRRRRLEALFDEHAAAVRAYALRRINPASADDTVSDVFVVACRRIDEIPADALPWLLACARRVLANQYRGARRRLALVDRLSALDGKIVTRPGTDDAPDALLRALESLSAEDRELLMMIAWEGLEPARAAAALECSRATLAVRLHRARRRLAAALEAVGGDTPLNSRSTPMEAVK